jgi:hypothetical protein
LDFASEIGASAFDSAFFMTLVADASTVRGLEVEILDENVPSFTEDEVEA